jgi:cellulose synthase/poly-beta-1,6-N-acetylglucosamine synthase-like glycosyltransferase
MHLSGPGEPFGDAACSNPDPCQKRAQRDHSHRRIVRSLLYPWTEIVVINDGSTDDTLNTLISHYNLRRIDPLYRDIIKTRPVKGFYYTSEIPNLIVVDKENGGKSDALNCGINVCKSPYICTLDADSVFEPESLIRLVTPLVQSTIPVIASGGVVRVLNGVNAKWSCERDPVARNSSLAIFQIVEYLRSFLFGRVGLDALNCNLILSGAFSLFRRLPSSRSAVFGWET